MLAAVLKKPGEIVLENVPTPEPGDGEVLLKVEACALCGTDKRVLSGEKKVFVPIVGHEIAGIVVGLGKGVTGIPLGKRYAVQTVIGCGTCKMCLLKRQNLCQTGFATIGYTYNGGFCEYMIMPKAGVDQNCLIPLPDSMDYECGTLLEPLSCGINGLRSIPLENMDHVIIIGAGVIGVLNGLIARARGAKRVSILNRSRGKLDLIQEMGLPFDDLVDMSVTPALEWVEKHTDGKGVDCVIVSASEKSMVSLGLGLLGINGHLSLFAGMPKSNPIEPIDLNLIHYRELHLHGASGSVQRDFLEAIDYLESGKIDGKRLITHRFPLAKFKEAVEAHNDAKSGALKVILKP